MSKNTTPASNTDKIVFTAAAVILGLFLMLWIAESSDGWGFGGGVDMDKSSLNDRIFIDRMETRGTVPMPIVEDFANSSYPRDICQKKQDGEVYTVVNREVERQYRLSPDQAQNLAAAALHVYCPQHW